MLKMKDGPTICMKTGASCDILYKQVALNYAGGNE